VYACDIFGIVWDTYTLLCIIKKGETNMKNKELIEILIGMDLEKEVKIEQDFMIVTITKDDVKEKEIITIRSI
jgi:endonuclease III-like uncharacterized protein